MSYLIRAYVPGDLGPGTELDTSVHPPRVTRLHLIVDTWEGDDLVECFPTFLVTERLAQAIDTRGLSGVKWARAQVEKSAQAIEFFQWTLPEWRWLQLGDDQKADLWLDDSAGLHVSDRTLDLLHAFNLDHAQISPDQAGGAGSAA